MTINVDPMETATGQFNKSLELPGEGRSGDVNVGDTSTGMIIKQLD